LETRQDLPEEKGRRRKKTGFESAHQSWKASTHRSLTHKLLARPVTWVTPT
jgi:hypothetical protein